MIFRYIETFRSPSMERRFERQWVPTESSTLTPEGDTWIFPKISPDFSLLDITDESPRHRTLRSKDNPPHFWRHRSAFAQINPSPAQGPMPSDLERSVKPIVTQAADYARLHISARPFQLFSVALLIFGSQFCVAIFDRDGVQFSPVYDMWADLPTFIRVVRRLACDMSPVELGQDPTVHMLSDIEAASWRKRAESLGLQTPNDGHFPTYAITMGQGSRCWYTLGPPIWSSLSLLGRGTVVWRVCDSSDPGRVMVLKNAWRNSTRRAESAIYASIKGKHPGVADYELGADVVFPGGGERVISANSLRGDDKDSAATAVLHRLLVSTLGRPLWEFRSELELLKGLRAALKGCTLFLVVSKPISRYLQVMNFCPTRASCTATSVPVIYYSPPNTIRKQAMRVLSRTSNLHSMRAPWIRRSRQ